jgi:SAM-dependent methyltransferase
MGQLRLAPRRDGKVEGLMKDRNLAMGLAPNPVGEVVYDLAIDPTSRTSSHAAQFRFARGARSVLDIGCSTGFFSQHLVAEGCHVVGVELNPIAAAKARRVCHQVIVGDIESPEVQAQIDRRFDAVLLGDVLEHLRAPATLLRQIRESWLLTDGWVVLSVPNSGHWVFRREVLRGRFPYRQYGLFDRTHLRFLTRASLWQLASDCGYAVEESACTVNSNQRDDLTFALMAPLYRHDRLRIQLVRIERLLAFVLPTLFAYQFVLRIRPRS